MLNFKSTVAVMAMLPLGLFAQKDVVSAYNANQDGDYLKAAEFIDQAILDAKANIKNKTWRYRGNIYTNLAADSALYASADALDKLAGFAKADELDVKQRYNSERGRHRPWGDNRRQLGNQLLQFRRVWQGRGAVRDRIGNDHDAGRRGYDGHLQQRVVLRKGLDV